MLNLVLVKSLVTVVRLRSFQAAAEELGLAQPTVSQHVQKLEEQLGVRMIHRARSGCEPTRAAAAFLPYAQSLLRLNDRALAALKGEHLRVGTSSNIGIYLLQPYLKRYLDGREPSSVDLVIDRNPTIAELLETSEVDVALMEWWQPRPGVEAVRWRTEPVVLIVPPGHALASRAWVDKATLAGLELLGGEPGTGTGRLLAGYFGREGMSPRVSLQLGSTEAVKQAVKAGLGVSLVLASAVSEELAMGSLVAVPLAEPLGKALYVAWRSGGRAARRPAFVEHLLAEPEALPA